MLKLILGLHEAEMDSVHYYDLDGLEGYARLEELITIGIKDALLYYNGLNHTENGLLPSLKKKYDINGKSLVPTY